MAGKSFKTESKAFDKAIEFARRNRAEVYVIRGLRFEFYAYPGDPMEMIYEFPGDYTVVGVVFGLGTILRCDVPMRVVAGPLGLTSLPSLKPSFVAAAGQFAVVFYPNELRVGTFEGDEFSFDTFKPVVRNIPDTNLAIDIANALMYADADAQMKTFEQTMAMVRAGEID